MFSNFFKPISGKYSPFLVLETFIFEIEIENGAGTQVWKNVGPMLFFLILVLGKKGLIQSRSSLAPISAESRLTG